MQVTEASLNAGNDARLRAPVPAAGNPNDCSSIKINADRLQNTITFEYLFLDCPDDLEIRFKASL